jgi:hypothetical protein
MNFGDRMRMSAVGADGRHPFGKIDQQVVETKPVLRG